MWELGQRPAREGAALFGALVLHAVVLALIARVAVPGSLVARPGARDAVADALDVELLAGGVGAASAPASVAALGAVQGTTLEPAHAGRLAIAPAPHRTASEH